MLKIFRRSCRGLSSTLSCPGSLCSDVKSLIVSVARPSKGRTLSHIELSLDSVWIAKKFDQTVTCLKNRHHICRDQCDRWSHNFFVNCGNFVSKQRESYQNLHKLTHTAKLLRKICNKWSNLHILRKKLCSFYAKCVIIGQIYTYCLKCFFYTHTHTIILLFLVFF